MSGSETVIVGGRAAGKGKTRTVSHKIPLDKIMLKLSEGHVPKEVEGADFFFLLMDLMDALKTEAFFSFAVDLEQTNKPIVKLLQDDAKSVSKEEFLNEIQKFLATRRVSWVDTDQMIFDWSDLHSLNPAEVISRLESAPISQAYLGMERDDGGNDYLTYKITN